MMVLYKMLPQGNHVGTLLRMPFGDHLVNEVGVLLASDRYNAVYAAFQLTATFSVKKIE